MNTIETLTRTVLEHAYDGRSIHRTEHIEVEIVWPHGYDPIKDANARDVSNGNWTLSFEKMAKHKEDVKL